MSNSLEFDRCGCLWFRSGTEPIFLTWEPPNHVPAVEFFREREKVVEQQVLTSVIPDDAQSKFGLRLEQPGQRKTFAPVLNMQRRKERDARTGTQHREKAFRTFNRVHSGQS